MGVNATFRLCVGVLVGEELRLPDLRTDFVGDCGNGLLGVAKGVDSAAEDSAWVVAAFFSARIFATRC